MEDSNSEMSSQNIPLSGLAASQSLTFCHIDSRHLFLSAIESAAQRPYGYAATREEVMKAFAKSWRRE
jgi:hypothetical protein